MIENSGHIIFKNFICDNSNTNIQQVWDCCPNKELWELLIMRDVTILTRECALKKIKESPVVFAFPEVLPAIYLGVAPTCAVVRTSKIALDISHEDCILAMDGYSIFGFEPLYIVDQDYSWMIVMTPENTPDGKQICALISRLNEPRKTS